MPDFYDPQKHHRRSIRLKDYDYTQPGAYFVTICVHERECLFGEVIDGLMDLNGYGQIAQREWQRLSAFTMIHHDRITSMSVKVVATNRKARHEYFILDQLEAGLVLQGSEIKSIRAGQISLAEAYVRIDNGEEAWLVEAHIAPYDQASYNNHEPRRPRKLLLHKTQIRKLWDEMRQKGVTIIPLQVYLKEGRAKIEIAVAKGKKLYDKRQDIARRDMEREIERTFNRRG
jgi:SsrA-binding protein